MIECDYNPSVVKKLATGQLVAIPNVQTLGADDIFSVYEIADVFPMHYSQPNLDRSQPAAIRKEFMELIESEWKKGSKSTWIEIVAAPIGYVMRTSADGSIAFERKPYAPLAGSSVRLLSRDSVEKLICYRVPEGAAAADYRFGNLLGVIDDKIPFTVDIEKLIHFHVGVFAFTGCGQEQPDRHGHQEGPQGHPRPEDSDTGRLLGVRHPHPRRPQRLSEQGPLHRLVRGVQAARPPSTSSGTSAPRRSPTSSPSSRRRSRSSSTTRR